MPKLSEEELNAIKARAKFLVDICKTKKCTLDQIGKWLNYSKGNTRNITFVLDGVAGDLKDRVDHLEQAMKKSRQACSSNEKRNVDSFQYVAKYQRKK
jgi:hypothetical protein